MANRSTTNSRRYPNNARNYSQNMNRTYVDGSAARSLQEFPVAVPNHPRPTISWDGQMTPVIRPGTGETATDRKSTAKRNAVKKSGSRKTTAKKTAKHRSSASSSNAASRNRRTNTKVNANQMKKTTKSQTKHSAQRNRQLSKVAQRNREKAMSLSRGFVVFIAVICIAVLGVTVYYLQLKAELTVKKNEINVMETRLSEIREDNDAYYSQVVSNVDLPSIKKIAIGHLGMKAPSDEQTVNYESAVGSYVRQYQDVPSSK